MRFRRGDGRCDVPDTSSDAPVLPFRPQSTRDRLSREASKRRHPASQGYTSQPDRYTPGETGIGHQDTGPVPLEAVGPPLEVTLTKDGHLIVETQLPSHEMVLQALGLAVQLVALHKPHPGSPIEARFTAASSGGTKS